MAEPHIKAKLYTGQAADECALVAELEYARRLGRRSERIAGSNPAEGTTKLLLLIFL